MEREEQLRWERDNARWAAGAAFASAALTIAAGVYLINQVSSPSNPDAVDQIKLLHEHRSDVILATALQAVATVLLAPTIYYLFRATRLRREQLPSALRYLVLLAPPLGAVTTLIHQIQALHAADIVVGQLPLDVEHAKDLVKDEIGKGSVVAVGGVGTAAGLGIAFSFVITSLNAMRAGLLSRFMGVLGIIVGVLLVIPLQGNLPVVQVFWVAALGALFLNRWPQGRGPAWDAGEAIPWPTAQDRRDALTGGSESGAEPEPDPGDEPVEAEEIHTREAARPRASSTHPRSKKRKRKRRG